MKELLFMTHLPIVMSLIAIVSILLFF